MANNTHFDSVPTIKTSRSTFRKTHSHKTTFNAGKLVPVYVDEVIPGDTHKINISSLIRGSTPIVPVMDNAYLDLQAFFVPMRLI